MVSRLIDADATTGLDDAGAELDRRAVALANDPQAHHEPHFTIADAVLIGMGDHRRVADGGPLDGVLLREVGADQLPLCGRQRGRALDPVGDEREVLLERGAEIGVAIGERRLHVAEHGRHLAIGQRQHPVDHRPGPRFTVDDVLLPRHEQLGQDPTGIGAQPVAAAANLDR